ncbi:hypothetical protein DMB42_14825 [Nonomuraea sp. WAC 01424]|nr:hypothetical protein DMB42_14825 [Nonomuraea sp. WAC 01424]
MDFLAQAVQRRFHDGVEPPSSSVTFGGSCSTIALLPLPPRGRALNHAEFSFEKKEPFAAFLPTAGIWRDSGR